jgi:hypothetical protein
VSYCSVSCSFPGNERTDIPHTKCRQRYALHVVVLDVYQRLGSPVEQEEMFSRAENGSVFTNFIVGLIIIARKNHTKLKTQSELFIAVSVSLGAFP